MTCSAHPCPRRWRKGAARALSAVFTVSVLLIAVLAGPRALACLVLLGMLVTAFAVRSRLKAGRRCGRHRYGARSHAPGRSRRGVAASERRQAEPGTGQAGDRTTAQPIGLPQAACTGVVSLPQPPAMPSAAASQGALRP